VRRQPVIAFVALILAGGAVLAGPPLTGLDRSPIPVGAVLPAIGAPAGRPVASVAPTADPAPAVTPAPAGSGPTGSADLDPRSNSLAWLNAPAVQPTPLQLTGYRWPLANGIITQPFGTSPYGALLVSGQRLHDGIDIASFCGDKVVAAHDGRVLAAGRRFDPYVGWIGSLTPHIRRMNRLGAWSELPITIIVDDGDGYRAIYAHFNALSVKAGDYVRAGQQIGWEGSTGFATGCHVHFGLFSPTDPARFELRPDITKRTRYPAWEIARINPILVLPPLPPGKTSGPFPSPSPSPAP
jgi:murein DD-endopeptidase MepM/ murein hydrolase activator NlpD